jgi:polysaccharide biosynthesis transport protein
MTTINPTRPALAPPARPTPPSAAAGAAGVPVVDPIKLLQKYKWLLTATAVVGVVLGIAAHFALLRLYPIYHTSIVYECIPLENDAASLGGNLNTRDELEKFQATQVQTMLSDGLIERAVNHPRLLSDAPNWSSQFMNRGNFDKVRAATSMRRRLSAGVVGDSNFVKMTFSWTQPDEAVAVARIIGEEYVRDRRLIATSDLNGRKEILSQQIKQAEDRIQARQKDRERILENRNVDALDAAVSSANLQMRDIGEQLTKIRLDIQNFETQYRQLASELESKTGISYPDTIRKRVEDDPVILNQKQQINLIESELAAMALRLGRDHRDRRRVEQLRDSKLAVLDETRERLLRQEFDAQLDGLRRAIASTRAQEADQLKTLEEARARAIELTQIQSQVKNIEDEISRINESRAKFSDAMGNLEVVTWGKNQSRIVLRQDAMRPRTVSFPKLYIMAPAGLFILLGLVGGVILVIEVIDQRVKSPADIAMIPRTRVLGLVAHASEDPANPTKIETVFRDQPGGVMAEHFRQVRGNVLKRMQQGGHKTLVVMSGMPDSGATTVVTNLALALAAAEQRVLVIDANFRRPSLHKILGKAESPGLADVLAASRTLADCTQRTDNERLSILSAGSADNRMFERLGTEAMGELLRDAATQYDIVLVDVAPAMVSGDALAVANRADASMLVVRALGEKRGMVARLRNDLGDARAEFLGVLVNAARSAAGGYLRGNILATHRYRSPEGK